MVRKFPSQGVGAFALVRHDIAQCPAAAAPGVREIPGALPGIEPALPRFEAIERDVDRCCEIGARGLGQNAYAAVVVLVRARRCPGVVRRVDRDAGLPLPGQLPGHRGAERVHAVDQQRVDVGLDRIEIGRKEQPRPV